MGLVCVVYLMFWNSRSTLYFQKLCKSFSSFFSFLVQFPKVNCSTYSEVLVKRVPILLRFSGRDPKNNMNHCLFLHYQNIICIDEKLKMVSVLLTSNPEITTIKRFQKSSAESCRITRNLNIFCYSCSRWSAHCLKGRCSLYFYVMCRLLIQAFTDFFFNLTWRNNWTISRCELLFDIE